MYQKKGLDKSRYRFSSQECILLETPDLLEYIFGHTVYIRSTVYFFRKTNFYNKIIITLLVIHICIIN